jgi:competence protein ComEC
MPPLAFLAISWIAGLVIAHHWLAPLGLGPASIALLSLIPAAAFLLWRKDRAMRLTSACALALFLGALRYELSIPDLDDAALVAHYNDRGWVTITGVVAAHPDIRDTWTNLELSSEEIELEGLKQPVKGIVLVRAPRFPEVRYGERLRVSGLLETPPEFEDFSYRDYLARKDVYSLLRRPSIEQIASSQGNPFWTAIFAVRDRAREVVARLVPDPAASLLQGILLGTKTGIPPDLYDDFNATGTSHVLVISGANITIVAALFARIFGRILGKRRAYWFTILGITAYVLLVGADPAVARAGLMGGLFVTAMYLGRRATAYVSLLASAVILTALTPLALWDVGFQLSFAATLSLILFAPPLERLLERGLVTIVPPERAKLVVGILNDVLIVTLAAQILTTPVVAYHFGRLSLVSPITNLLILPAQMPIMIGGGAAALIGLVPLLEPVAQVLFWVPWLFLAYTVAVVRWTASWPFASLEVGPVDLEWIALYGVLLLGAVWLLGQRRRGTLHLPAWTGTRRSTTITLGGLLVAATLLWLAILQLPDGRLHVAFLDVGQGDAIFITTPRGRQILVDGGPSPAALTSALGREMPFWDRSIDLVIMTHADADHITGLAEVLERYELAGWIDSGTDDPNALYLRCRELLTEKGVPHHAVQTGDRLDLGQGIVIEILHPPGSLMAGTDADSNNNSVVLRLSWDNASFLLTGDAEAEAEQLLLQTEQVVAADVLKVAHHGSADASMAGFLASVDPSFAVISVGVDNPFGHPAPAVLDRLDQQGDVTVLRTDLAGTVEFTTDGRRLWIKEEHRNLGPRPLD